MKTESARLFFALWPDEAQRTALTAMTEVLPAEWGRRVIPANLHITLLFLGAVNDATRRNLEAAAARIIMPPFVLTLDQYGYWPQPQIVWAGSQNTPPALLRLVHALRQAALVCGLRVDNRPYQPHLTLCRKVRQPPQLPKFSPFYWPAADFSLVESRSAPGGVRYEPCRAWALRVDVDSTSEAHSVE